MYSRLLAMFSFCLSSREGGSEMKCTSAMKEFQHNRMPKKTTEKRVTYKFFLQIHWIMTKRWVGYRFEDNCGSVGQLSPIVAWKTLSRSGHQQGSELMGT